MKKMSKRNNLSDKLRFTSPNFDPILALKSKELAERCSGAKVFDNLRQYIIGLSQSASFKSIGWFPEEFCRYDVQQRRSSKRKASSLFDNRGATSSDTYSSDVDDGKSRNIKQIKLTNESKHNERQKSESDTDVSFRSLFSQSSDDAANYSDQGISIKCRNIGYKQRQAVKCIERSVPKESNETKLPLQSRLRNIAKHDAKDVKLSSSTNERFARLRNVMTENLEKERKSVIAKSRENVFKKMEACQYGPLSVLYNCMNKGIKLKVWTRRYKGLRGVCTGYLIAFDKHMNLAMIDVDEVYTLEIRTLSQEEQDEIKKKKKAEKKNRYRLNRIKRNCEFIDEKENNGIVNINSENVLVSQGIPDTSKAQKETCALEKAVETISVSEHNALSQHCRSEVAPVKAKFTSLSADAASENILFKAEILLDETLPSADAKVEKTFLVDGASSLADVALENLLLAGAASEKASSLEASTSADVASTSVDVASTSVDVASTSADVASTSADVASTSVDVASTSADVASTSADVASTSVDVASTSADVASTSVDVVSTSGDVASTSADVASTSADVASISADVASTSADVASTSADVASTSVDVVPSPANIVSSSVEFASGKAHQVETEIPTSDTSFDISESSEDETPSNDVRRISDSDYDDEEKRNKARDYLSGVHALKYIRTLSDLSKDSVDSFKDSVDSFKDSHKKTRTRTLYKTGETDRNENEETDEKPIRPIRCQFSLLSRLAKPEKRQINLKMDEANKKIIRRIQCQFSVFSRLAKPPKLQADSENLSEKSCFVKGKQRPEDILVQIKKNVDDKRVEKQSLKLMVGENEKRDLKLEGCVRKGNFLSNKATDEAAGSDDCLEDKCKKFSHSTSSLIGNERKSNRSKEDDSNEQYTVLKNYSVSKQDEIIKKTGQETQISSLKEFSSETSEEGKANRPQSFQRHDARGYRRSVYGLVKIELKPRVKYSEMERLFYSSVDDNLDVSRDPRLKRMKDVKAKNKNKVEMLLEVQRHTDVEQFDGKKEGVIKVRSVAEEQGVARIKDDSREHFDARGPNVATEKFVAEEQGVTKEESISRKHISAMGQNVSGIKAISTDHVDARGLGVETKQCVAKKESVTGKQIELKEKFDSREQAAADKKATVVQKQIILNYEQQTEPNSSVSHSDHTLPFNFANQKRKQTNLMKQTDPRLRSRRSVDERTNFNQPSDMQERIADEFSFLDDSTKAVCLAPSDTSNKIRTLSLGSVGIDGTRPSVQDNYSATIKISAQGQSIIDGDAINRRQTVGAMQQKNQNDADASELMKFDDNHKTDHKGVTSHLLHDGKTVESTEGETSAINDFKNLGLLSISNENADERHFAEKGSMLKTDFVGCSETNNSIKKLQSRKEHDEDVKQNLIPKSCEEDQRMATKVHQTEESALGRFFQKRRTLLECKEKESLTKLNPPQGKSNVVTKTSNAETIFCRRNVYKSNRTLPTVSAVFDGKNPIKNHIFKERHINQIFIRGDNIAMVAYDKLS